MGTQPRPKTALLKPKTVAVGWRNRIAVGPTALFIGTILCISAFTSRYIALAPFYLLAGLAGLAGAVSACRSGRVQIDASHLTMTRLWRRRVVVARDQIADVVIRTARFGNRPSLGRNVNLVLHDGRVVPIEIVIPNKKGPDPKVEGLADVLRAWVTDGVVANR